MRPLRTLARLSAVLVIACSPRPAPDRPPPPRQPVVVPEAPPAPPPPAPVAVATPDAGAPVAAAAPTTDPAVHVRMFRGRSEDDWIAQLSTRPVLRMISRHSSTATVFRMDLGDGIEIGFKPSRPGQERWWRHEIVSYRLARILGIEGRVPPVVGRHLDGRLFGNFLHVDAMRIARDGLVPGSASVWMPALHGERLHEPRERRHWTAWLDPRQPWPTVPAENERARQISELLVFDYLMANFDRWNCCNIPLDENNQIVMRDNDAGWFPDVMNRVGSPDVVHRLPRHLYAALRTATGEALRAEVARDPRSNEGLLLEGAVPAYDRRREALLRHIEALIRTHGEANVLGWN